MVTKVLERKQEINYDKGAKRKRMKIYIAHTYGRKHGMDDDTLEKNAYLSIWWGRQIILKGHNPFIPNLFHFVHKDWPESPDEERYFSLVSDWIEDCDALFVARMPSWEGSGVAREVKIAEELGIPIYYSINDIPVGMI